MGTQYLSTDKLIQVLWNIGGGVSETKTSFHVSVIVNQQKLSNLINILSVLGWIRFIEGIIVNAHVITLYWCCPSILYVQ